MVETANEEGGPGEIVWKTPLRFIRGEEGESSEIVYHNGKKTLITGEGLSS